MVAVLDVPRGRFYGPCSGQDLPIAFELFGDTINRFTFCDLGYRGPNTTAKEAVPENWTLASRIQGVDEALPEKTTWYSRNRPFRPRSTLETWRRPDGSEVLVELRYDLDDVPGGGVARRGPRAFRRAELVSRSALQAG